MDKLVHFELPADDIARAKKFYGSIFGWELEDYPMPDGSQYVGVRTVAVDEKTRLPKEADAINGGIVPRSKENNMPILAINVSSIDEYVKKIEKGGGKVVRPKMNVMDMGYYAYVEDTEGNVIGLWEDMKKA